MHSPIEKLDEKSDKILVFIHGFMGSPTQFDYLIKAADDRGFSVISLLLPGHGKSGFYFAANTSKSWENHLEEQLKRLSHYNEIYLIGHSIGGLLALNASLKFDFNGLILLATPLKFNIFTIDSIFKKSKLIFNMVDKDIRKSYIDANSIGKPYFVSMPFWFRVLLQPLKLLIKTRKNLQEISTPILLIYSQADETTSVKSSHLFDKLLTKAKHKTIFLAESWHAHYTETEKENIKTSIFNFISEQAYNK